ncbi:MAG: type 1 glutamine amidotransferase [Planctomycetes bacterium]|nr:type 1 glutamine amidotransferase [Planctomycetota bacterium]
MVKRIAVFVENQYQELEVWYPYYRLKEAGFDIDLIGTEKTTYKSKVGYPVEANISIKSADPSNYQALVIPGGFAPDFMRRTPDFALFTKQIFSQGKIVAAICHGVWICASAGILKGQTATCFYAIKDDVINAGAEYVDKDVVVSGNLITSRKPDDLPSFTKAIISKLSA